jgi:hypothetical protein
MVATAGRTPSGPSRLIGAQPDVARVGLPPAPTGASPLAAHHDTDTTTTSSRAGSVRPEAPPANTSPTAAGDPSIALSGHATSTEPLVAPRVTRIAPASGPIAGGTQITIAGAGFSPGAVVYFGSETAKHVIVVNATTLRVIAPPARLVAGGTSAAASFHGLKAPIVVRTAGGTSDTSATAVRFTYL